MNNIHAAIDHAKVYATPQLHMLNIESTLNPLTKYLFSKSSNNH